mmetsp:Transcript_32391/g.38700  ORF Transcript_32391/g.38700 Transcript_32391/m.38700 type:complete len:229 (-) Transcript_32391:8-694(-)
MGGYRDKTAQSSAITSHVVRLFATLAAEYASTTTLTMELSTCAVTSLNDQAFLLGTNTTTTTTTTKNNNHSNTMPQSRPIAGGLSLNITTGTIHYLSQVHESLRGPASTLRRVRLWSPASSSPTSNTSTLMVVHTTTDECVVVSPFEFRPFADLDLLMALPDNRMLRYTSTSPECEADDFCDLVRESFVFLRDVAVGDVFGSRRRTMMCDDNHDDDDDDDNSLRTFPL